MKKILTILAVPALAFFLSSSAFAAGGKEITVKGQATCAKCSLKLSDECENVITATNKKGKEVTYWLASQDQHKALFCKGKTGVVAVGKCVKEGDKLVL
ncbi:MAG: hypothetical protein ACC661_08950, partial [Verrucomicrobiales bacterium]